MGFSFESKTVDKAFGKIGLSGNGIKVQVSKVIIPLLLCWLPLVLVTIIQGTFWTGDSSTSFITSFDTQVRFLVSMPIFILAERRIMARLGTILNQFVESGMVVEEDQKSFESMIQRHTSFLKSRWTLLAIYVFCYLQVFLVLFYESSNTSFLLWQMKVGEGDQALNLAGMWSTLISRPFVLFLFYRWLLIIAVWGKTLHKISKLNLILYPEHPDLSGGLGYLGYGIRYFAPIAFAISAGVAGNMADFMMIEGMHIADLKLPAIGYFIFMSLLFALPLMSFTGKMINARESIVFDNYDFANGMYRELRATISKKFNQVNQEDLSSVAYSAVSDYNGVVNNVLNMKYIPFTWRDMVPLWFMTALPFLAVALLEIPMSELFQKLFSIMV